MNKKSNLPGELAGSLHRMTSAGMGPLGGALAQGALFGIPTYFLTKALLADENEKKTRDAHRVALVSAIAAGLGGSAINLGGVLKNWRRSSGMPFMQRLGKLNALPGELPPTPKELNLLGEGADWRQQNLMDYKMTPEEELATRTFYTQQTPMPGVYKQPHWFGPDTTEVHPDSLPLPRIKPLEQPKPIVFPKSSAYALGRMLKTAADQGTPLTGWSYKDIPELEGLPWYTKAIPNFKINVPTNLPPVGATAEAMRQIYEGANPATRALVAGDKRYTTGTNFLANLPPEQRQVIDEATLKSVNSLQGKPRVGWKDVVDFKTNFPFVLQDEDVVGALDKYDWRKGVDEYQKALNYYGFNKPKAAPVPVKPMQTMAASGPAQPTKKPPAIPMEMLMEKPVTPDEMMSKRVAATSPQLAKRSDFSGGADYAGCRRTSPDKDLDGTQALKPMTRGRTSLTKAADSNYGDSPLSGGATQDKPQMDIMSPGSMRELVRSIEHKKDDKKLGKFKQQPLGDRASFASTAVGSVAKEYDDAAPAGKIVKDGQFMTKLSAYVRNRNWNTIPKSIRTQCPDMCPDKQADYFDTPVQPDVYGGTGIFGRYQTWLPPGMQGPTIPTHYTAAQIDNDPYMSPQQKSIALMHLDNASDGRTGLITGGDVARAAMGAGIGYASASLFGKVLGGIFGGLSPITQRRLQGAGAIAGLLINTGAIGGRH